MSTPTASAVPDIPCDPTTSATSAARSPRRTCTRPSGAAPSWRTRSLCRAATACARSGWTRPARFRRSGTARPPPAAPRSSVVERCGSSITAPGRCTRWTRQPVPSGNLALNRPATGSSPCNSNETPGKAVNGSVSGGNGDKWCSSAKPLNLTVDLGSSVPLSQFVVRHAGAGGESRSLDTRDYDLQVSPDGAAFTTVAQVRGNTADATTTTVSATGRFVRLHVLTPRQSGGNHG